MQNPLVKFMEAAGLTESRLMQATGLNPSSVYLLKNGNRKKIPPALKVVINAAGWNVEQFEADYKAYQEEKRNQELQRLANAQ